MATHRLKVEIEDVLCIAQSKNAILCVIDNKEVWIPQSQVDDDSEVWKKGDSGALVVSEWIAMEKGLI